MISSSYNYSDPNEAAIYAAIGGWRLTKVLVSGRPGAV
jgi:hypothetical protein